MNRMNTAGRLLALLLLALMVLSLAACGAKGGDKMDGMSNEPKNADGAGKCHSLGEHSALGKGIHGGRQGHDHAGRRQKLR